MLYYVELIVSYRKNQGKKNYNFYVQLGLSKKKKWLEIYSIVIMDTWQVVTMSVIDPHIILSFPSHPTSSLAGKMGHDTDLQIRNSGLAHFERQLN